MLAADLSALRLGLAGQSAARLDVLDDAARQRPARRCAGAGVFHSVAVCQAFGRDGPALAGLMAACVIGTGVCFYLAFEPSQRDADAGVFVAAVSRFARSASIETCVSMKLAGRTMSILSIGSISPLPKIASRRIRRLALQAYFNTWIIADNAAPKRWRPVAWADLPNIVKPTEDSRSCRSIASSHAWSASWPATSSRPSATTRRR